jgi:hypothetical protein
MQAEHSPDSQRQFLAATAGDAGNDQWNGADQGSNENRSQRNDVRYLYCVVSEGLSGHGKLLCYGFTHNQSNIVPAFRIPDFFRNPLIPNNKLRNFQEPR